MKGYISKALTAVSMLALMGCSYPSNVVNDIVHTGDPTYDNCRNHSDMLSDYGARCAREADPDVKAAKAEQMRQAAEQQKLMDEKKQQFLIARQNEEITNGYSPLTVRDFFLDGRKLASLQAKRSLTGVLLPVGSADILFGANIDAIQFANGQNQSSPSAPLLTESASRKFRSQLLSCRNNPSAAYVGCHVHILGKVVMCVQSDLLGNQRNVPCISVDEGNIE